ncbi:MAG TPA: pyridine nucleotide-disulfide oxidoreductase, partial [Chromatiales bacterium]|nr:pyridine nucleotide-disulfide oxidoreductase [Chromatiales bacterium]
HFLKLLGASALAGAGLSGKGALAAAQPHVVVIGGGVGGATFAKYLKLADKGIKVTIVEKERQYIRPYGSSEVIPGHIGIKDITISYQSLQKNYGIEFVFDTVTGIDFDGKTVRTAGGTRLSYDRLVVSPGISFNWAAIEGLTPEVADTLMPHAWIPGKQTELLAKQLKAVPQGGTVLVCPPPNPYRCPPGPYERAGLIAQYMKENNPTAKVIILDSKNGFTTDLTMLQAWNELYGFNIPEAFKGYSEAGLKAAGFTDAEIRRQLAAWKPVKHDKPGMIEWVMGDMGGRVVKVDPDTMTVHTESGSYKGDMINIIPQHKAGQLALDTGLADSSGWCPVDPVTFESTLHKNVHVIGDSSIAGDMPKSGYSAASQAKVVALQVKSLLRGEHLGDPLYQNTCYALAGHPEWGQFVADVFRIKDGRITRVPARRYMPLDASPVQRRLAATYTHAWMTAFTDDCFA